jgi:hypothetical protein
MFRGCVWHTSIPHRHAYQSTRSTASAVVWTAQVVSSTHSIGSPPAGGCSSTTWTAQTAILGGFSAVRCVGGPNSTRHHRTATVAWRAGCGPRRGPCTVSVATIG